ncbi:hypothetical protein FBU30_008144 [Linnemannia zychae]|nr:hypothetical protein FBU30_008144 [Linnemannia zychae]
MTNSDSTFRANNFISIHDLTPQGRTLWVSASVYDCLGYTPEEFLQTTTYELLHPDDVALASVTHRENVLNDMVATQVVLRFRAKDVRGMTLHSAAMTRLAGSRKEEFERIRRHHEAFGADSWNTGELEPEARACMILNRFSNDLGVMYASPSCELVLQIDPSEIAGKPLLLFIRADDLGKFVEQADLAKSSTMMTHMRFWFQSPNSPQEIPVEAMLFGCADGMVAILRRSRPFIRKQMIGSLEHFDYFMSTGMSPLTSSLLVNRGNGTSRSRPSQSSISPSPPDVRVPNIDPAHSAIKDFRLPMVGMRAVPIGTIQNIQSLERDRGRFRPLTTVQFNDQAFGAIPRGYQLRGIVQIDSDDDDEEEEEESILSISDDDSENEYEVGMEQPEFDDLEGEYGDGGVYSQMENFSVVPSSPLN